MAGEFCGILSSIPGDHGPSPLFYPNTVIPSISVVCFKQKSVWFLDPVPGLASYSSASSSPFFTKTPSARLGLLWICHLSLIFPKLFFFLVHLIYCVCVCSLMNAHVCTHAQMCIWAHTHTAWCTYENQKTTWGNQFSPTMDPGSQIPVTGLGGKHLYLWDQLTDPPWYYWFIIVILGLGKHLHQWTTGKELDVVHIFELSSLERLETGEYLRLTGQPA